MTSQSPIPQVRQNLAETSIFLNCSPGGPKYARCEWGQIRISIFVKLKSVLKVVVSFSTATDFCSARPCENGGNCTNEADDFRCNCTEQWTGKNCSVGRYYLLFAVTFYQFTVLHCSQKVSFT